MNYLASKEHREGMGEERQTEGGPLRSDSLKPPQAVAAHALWGVKSFSRPFFKTN